LIEIPHTATLLATLHDDRFAAAVVIALLAGVVRGFAGFGSALIYVPLIAALYGPHIATVSFVLMDYVCVAPLVIRALPRCRWREILPAFAAAVITVPLGTMTQKALDPTVLRWGMSGLVILFVVLLSSGWRYPWKQGALAAACAGALSGFTGGAAQMPGPPAILYWLGGSEPAIHIRSNLLVFMMTVGLMLVASYAWHGLMTAKPIALGAMLWPVYIVALVGGARWFHGASDLHYRRVAYVIVALAAIVSLPVFDKILH
jgi:uncharacterized protein